MQIISNIIFEHNSHSKTSFNAVMGVNFFAFQRATNAVIYLTYHAYLLVAYLVQASFINKYFTNYKVKPVTTCFSFIIKYSKFVYPYTLNTVTIFIFREIHLNKHSIAKI